MLVNALDGQNGGIRRVVVLAEVCTGDVADSAGVLLSGDRAADGLEHRQHAAVDEVPSAGTA